MIELSYVEQERDESGKAFTRRDPRHGLSDFTVYTIHTRSMMTDHEMHEAGDYVVSLLQAADYDNGIFGSVARQPIASYATGRLHIKLILFSRFSDKEVMLALASGRKNLGY